MKHPRLYLSVLVMMLALGACHRPKPYSMIVENALIFDTRTGGVIPNKTILINGDTIVGIIDAGTPVRTKRVVDADGRLVVPGSIDASMHLVDAFANVKNKVAETHPKNLTSFYRNKFTKQFLPYGVTLAIDMGQSEEWQSQTSGWKSHPQFTELLVASQIGATSIKTSVEHHLEALKAAGIRYIYADNSLDVEMLRSIVDGAEKRDMVVFASTNEHTAFAGVAPNIEGLADLLINAISKYANQENFGKLVRNIYGDYATIPYPIIAMEAFNILASGYPQVLDSMVSILGRNRVSLSSTLHLMAVTGGLIDMGINMDSLVKFTPEQKIRIEYNFKHLLTYVKKLHESGVRFRIGTGCPNGGKAYIAEQMILAEAGIPVADIIQISTLRAAQVLRIDNHYGCIEVGQKADLIIYERNPLQDHNCFAMPRRIINNGKIYRRGKRNVDFEEIK